MLLAIGQSDCLQKFLEPKNRNLCIYFQDELLQLLYDNLPNDYITHNIDRTVYRVLIYYLKNKADCTESNHLETPSTVFALYNRL